MKSLVFGRGKSGRTFKQAVERLAEELGEGGGFADPPPPSAGKKRDGGVDIVVFRRFADRRAGQLIGFGQCKTGMLRDGKEYSAMSPDAFTGKWLKRGGFAVNPVRLFFQAKQVAGDEDMRALCLDAGILFDRCRIMEYAAKVDNELRRKICDWTRARWKSDGGKSLPF